MGAVQFNNIQNNEMGPVVMTYDLPDAALLLPIPTSFIPASNSFHTSTIPFNVWCVSVRCLYTARYWGRQASVKHIYKKGKSMLTAYKA